MPKVQVSILIEERVKYHTYIYMDEAEFKRLDDALTESGKSERKAAERLRDYIDPMRDWQDSDDPEVLEFAIRKQAVQS